MVISSVGIDCDSDIDSRAGLQALLYDAAASQSWSPTSIRCRHFRLVNTRFCSFVFKIVT